MIAQQYLTKALDELALSRMQAEYRYLKMEPVMKCRKCDTTIKFTRPHGEISTSYSFKFCPKHKLYFDNLVDEGVFTKA